MWDANPDLTGATFAKDEPATFDELTIILKLICVVLVTFLAVRLIMPRKKDANLKSSGDVNHPTTHFLAADGIRQVATAESIDPPRLMSPGKTNANLQSSGDTDHPTTRFLAAGGIMQVDTARSIDPQYTNQISAGEVADQPRGAGNSIMKYFIKFLASVVAFFAVALAAYLGVAMVSGSSGYGPPRTIPAGAFIAGIVAAVFAWRRASAPEAFNSHLGVGSTSGSLRLAAAVAVTWMPLVLVATFGFEVMGRYWRQPEWIRFFLVLLTPPIATPLVYEVWRWALKDRGPPPRSER